MVTSKFKLECVIITMTIGTFGAFTSPGAFAQPTEKGLEEIVVTARKRSEALLDVPVTITALSSKDIEVKAINELNDIVDFSPGFYYGGATVGRGDRSNRRLVMRGMQVNTDVDTRQGATLFIDGAPMLGSELGSTENVERIEVVKGPQSAYFGRATFGGAINIITKTPGTEFKAKVTGEVGQFGTTDFSLQAEGPVVPERLMARASASRYETSGQYRNATTPGQKLGARKTNDIAGTLYATPSDAFNAKMRFHYWEDSDGPSASVGYGLGNGEEYFNCRPPGSTIPAVSATNTNNWICGKVPFPKLSQIQGDFTVTPDIQANLLANNKAANPRLEFIFNPQFIDHFGLERRAQETSLIMNYEVDGGPTASSITAYHKNKWAALDDIDRRATLSQGNTRDAVILNNRDLSDFSQEVRLTSSDSDRLKWLAGASYYKLEALATSGSKQNGAFLAIGVGGANTVKTYGVFGSISYKLFEPLSLSVEARRQWDKVADGVIGAAPLTGTFKSFTPRVILDFKPNDETTLYLSWAKGNRPGEFNAGLVGLPQSVIDQVAAQIGAEIRVGEESLTNYEAGYKARLLDGRAQFTAAFYYAQWRNQHTRGIANVNFPNGSVQLIATTGTGGAINLQGFETEGAVAITDKLKFEGTFAINDTNILRQDCADCGLLFGNRIIDGLGKEFSRTPKYSGSFGAAYTDRLNDSYDWFAHIDYIFTGSRWNEEANLAKTGDSHRVNLRAGVENGSVRVEIYGKNVFGDKTLPGLQRLNDLAFGANRQIITAALPDRPTWGLRASYDF